MEKIPAVKKLHVYKGEWGLPSIDFDCIRTLCIIKFNEVPIDINVDGNPFFSKSGVMPYLECDGEKIVGCRQIISFLNKEGCNTSFNTLSAKRQFLSASYETYVFNNLHPYYQYTLFGDPKNVDDSRTLYAKRTKFPFNFYYPGKYNKNADDVMEVFAGFSIKDPIEEHYTEKILLNAQKCVNMLSQKLGIQKWFLGNLPTEFDAQVYAYLSILYNISLPNNPLQAHIRECPNLVKFIERITKKYFVKEGFSSKTQIKLANKNNSSTILTSSEQEFLATKTKTQIFFGIGAFFAMACYAAWLGLVQISRDMQYEEVYDYEEDDDIGESN